MEAFQKRSIGELSASCAVLDQPVVAKAPHLKSQAPSNNLNDQKVIGVFGRANRSQAPGRVLL
jgi:hypothetical protein